MTSITALPVKQAAKRKAAPKKDEDDDDSGSDSDVSMINVDFDFYNLNPEVDQIAVKRLLRQTLSHDDELVDVHPLAELILSEGVRIGCGSSIKTDGEESDPWGLVAVLDIGLNAENPALKPFLSYLISVLPKDSPLLPTLQSTSPRKSALLFSSRMLNLPLPLIPPLYRMLLSELDDAQTRGVVEKFDEFIIWGRGFKLDAGDEDTGLEMSETNGKRKKNKATKGPGAVQSGLSPYHPEEEFIEKLGKVHNYSLKIAPPRDSESFGVEQYGRLLAVSRQGLGKAVESMIEACK